MFAELKFSKEDNSQLQLSELAVEEIAVGVRSPYGIYLRVYSYRGTLLINLRDPKDNPDETILVRRMRYDEQVVLTNTE